MFRPVRRSLQQTLVRAVIKACAFTFAMFISYVSTAVVADMGNLSQGHQDEPSMVDLGFPAK
jgi:hypothetical protein